ncbi:hypothetical protein KC614_02505 [candidate division WWE3 bacterium]|uniref:Uncharacterized protein n=1 Tax=candidate division WWE3 bacterium TaxID=2053526 RepID=A0A955RRZ0_UNCKA|nr:hypothetical protein [candidate division WWE3 bacterium]
MTVDQELETRVLQAIKKNRLIENLTPNRISIMLAIVLIVFFVVSFYFSTTTDNPIMSDLFVNLSAGFVGSLVTVFIIEVFVRIKDSQKIRSTTKLLNLEFMSYLNIVVGNILFILHARTWSVENFGKDSIIEETYLRENINDLSTLLTDDSRLSNLNLEEYDAFLDYIERSLADLLELLEVYRPQSDSEVFKQMLDLRMNLKEIDRIFVITRDIFLKHEVFPSQELKKHLNQVQICAIYVLEHR